MQKDAVDARNMDAFKQLSGKLTKENVLRIFNINKWLYLEVEKVLSCSTTEWRRYREEIL